MYSSEQPILIHVYHMNISEQPVKIPVSPSKCPEKWLIKWLSHQKKIISQSFINSGTLIVITLYISTLKRLIIHVYHMYSSEQRV